MANDKYRILENDSRMFGGEKVYRIQALRDIDMVSAGDLGGYVASEENLSTEGDCWIFDHAVVAQDARVMDKAYLSGEACALGEAIVADNAHVGMRAVVQDYSCVGDYARVGGNSQVLERARVFGNAKMSDNSTCTGDAALAGTAILRDYAYVGGSASVLGSTSVAGNALIEGRVCVSDATIRADAFIKQQSDILVFAGVGSSYGGTLTAYRTVDGFEVTRGCFRGTLQEFLEAVYTKHGDTPYRTHYCMLADVIDHWFTVIQPMRGKES